MHGLVKTENNIENDLPAIFQFSKLLYENPEKCPGKFQFRVDESYLSTLDVGQVAQFFSIITDLEIMSCANFEMKTFRDVKEMQYVYQFTRK